MDKVLLRVEDAAEALSLSRAHMYRLINQGVLPAVHVGRSVRLRPEELRRWVESQASQGEPPEAA